MKENRFKMPCCELSPKGNEYRTLYKTGNFFVMPSVGGMGLTYLLVVSNEQVQIHEDRKNKGVTESIATYEFQQN